VAERHRGRDARLAWENLPSVFRGEEAQVEEVALEAIRRRHDLARKLREAEGLRHLAGARLVVTWCPVDEQHPA
jgi:hypothetical protein